MSTAAQRKLFPELHAELDRLRQQVIFLEKQLTGATVDSICAKADARALEAKCSGLEMALFRLGQAAA